MVTNNVTPNKSYPEPFSGNQLDEDVDRLVAALRDIDGDIQAIETALAGKAASSHTHSIANVIGLQPALDGKSATSHTHALDDLTDVDGAAAAPNGYLLVKTSGGWVPASPTSLGIGTASLTAYTETVASGPKATFTITGGYTVGGVQVFVNGVALSPSNPAEYTASNGTTVVVSDPLATGDSFVCIQYPATTIGTPSDGTVTTEKLASSTYASKSEAEAGSNNTKLMTPLRVADFYAANAVAPPVNRFGILPSNSAAQNISALSALDAFWELTGQETYFFPPGEYDFTGAPKSIYRYIFVGYGTLKGIYRKTVINPKAPRSLPLPPTFRPAKHMKNAARKANMVAVLIGDSLTGADDFPVWQIHNGVDPMLRRALAETWPDRNVTFHNRGIGGARWVDADGIWPGTRPAWYTDSGASWLSYVEALAPDVVFCAFGMNDGYNWTLGNFEAAYMLSVIAKIRSWKHECDVVLLTNMLPSLMSTEATVSTEYQMEGRDALAGVIRSVARMGGYGLIDLNRHFNVARDGIDVCAEYLGPTVTVTQAMPFLPTVKLRDYKMRATFAAIPSGFWDGSGGSNSPIRVPLSPNINNFASIRQFSGNLGLDLWLDDGVQFGSIRSAIAIPATGANVVIDVTVQGDNLIVQVNGASLYEGKVLRYGGVFSPEFRYALNEAGATGTFDLQAGSPAQYLPSLTDAQIYGFDSYTANGGNQINHPSYTGYAAIASPAILGAPWIDRMPAEDDALADELAADLGTLIDFSRNRYCIASASGMKFGPVSDIVVQNGGGSLSYVDDAQGYRMGLRLLAASAGAYIDTSTIPFSATGGTMLIDAYVDSLPDTYLAALGPNTDYGPRIELRTNASANPTFVVIDNASAVVCQMAVAHSAQSKFARFGASWAANNFVLNAIGSKTGFDFSGALPTGLTRLKLGYVMGTTVQTGSSVIRRLTLLPVALPSPQLSARLL